jgi:threonine dehydratase
VPVGNGALIAGIGTWLKSTAPSTRVIGVQAAAAPAMTLSWRERRPIETPTADTVADGIAARVPVPEALELMLEVVDEMLLVDEDQIVAATNQLSVACRARSSRQPGRHGRPFAPRRRNGTRSASWSPAATSVADAGPMRGRC